MRAECARFHLVARLFFLVLGIGLGTTKTAAADSSIVHHEPPSPITKHRGQVRSEQLTFLEELELWGISVGAEGSRDLANDQTPDFASFKMNWTAPDEATLTIGFGSPVRFSGFSFEGEYQIRD